MKKYFYHVLVLAIGYGVGFAYPTKGLLTASPVETKQSENVGVPNDFSEKALVALMKELKIKYPEIALSQARLETGNFTSAIFKENHNLFGMKMAEIRPTSAIGINRGHALYTDWKQSVIDYALFQSFIISKLKTVNKDSYRAHIQKYYSETSDYLARMDRVGLTDIRDDLLRGKL
ncbi:MAG: glucosaminidase domain-containing protein [Daejeonella sp.]|uniref:glucosaminidase domain-containing protein n=1 Tax=Daejeonella sp. JGW-45 TaxID=3034148 RepID=UPI0023EBEA8A|nr:glucosaminidase domain-containing protein [Daejeonella sp. JGW-45]